MKEVSKRLSFCFLEISFKTKKEIKIVKKDLSLFNII
jgi:hypothetical protein